MPKIGWRKELSPKRISETESGPRVLKLPKAGGLYHTTLYGTSTKEDLPQGTYAFT